MEYSIEKTVERIHSIMENEKITNKQLAAKSGVSVHTLGKVLRLETKEPSVSLIIDVANALNVSADYLIYGIESNNTVAFNVTTHEKAVITAYRNKPEMQDAVDKLLEVRDDARHKNIDISDYTANIAAGTGAEGFTPEKLKEVDDFARQVAELERNRSE